MPFGYRRSILDSTPEARSKKDTEKSGRSGQKPSDLIQQARKEFGRYFGICGSYHHLKACICKGCPSYSGGSGMFCSSGKSLGQGKKEGCLCETCEFFRKFRLEGEYFCLGNENQSSH